MRDREVSLVSVLGEIMIHWRGILLFLAVGMMLGGIFGIRQNSAARMELQSIPELSFLSKEKVRQLQGMEQEYEEELKRYEESPLVAMEDKAVYCGMIWYETTNKVIAVPAVSDKLYGTKEDREEFSQIIPDLTNNALKEIVYLTENNDADAVNNNNYITNNDNYRERGDDHTICIRVLSEDGEICLALMEQVKLSLQEFIIMDGIELKLIYENCSDDGQSYVRTFQRKRYEKIENLQRNIESLKAQLSEEELLYYRNGELDTAVEVIQPEDKGIILSYRMIILGGIAAVFIYACWIGFRYLLNNKIKAEDDLQVLYGIPEIQTIVQWQNCKNILDKHLLKLRCRLSRLSDPKEAVDIASKQILTLTGETQQPIAVWEWIREEKKVDAAQAFCDSLKDAGNEYIAGNFIMDSAEKIEDVSGIKTAVLIIQDNVVSYQEISRAITYLKRQEIHILGAIKLV